MIMSEVLWWTSACLDKGSILLLPTELCSIVALSIVDKPHASRIAKFSFRFIIVRRRGFANNNNKIPKTNRTKSGSKKKSSHWWSAPCASLLAASARVNCAGAPPHRWWTARDKNWTLAAPFALRCCWSCSCCCCCYCRGAPPAARSHRPMNRRSPRSRWWRRGWAAATRSPGRSRPSAGAGRCRSRWPPSRACSSTWSGPARTQRRTLSCCNRCKCEKRWRKTRSLSLIQKWQDDSRRHSVNSF